MRLRTSASPVNAVPNKVQPLKLRVQSLVIVENIVGAASELRRIWARRTFKVEVIRARGLVGFLVGS